MGRQISFHYLDHAGNVVEYNKGMIKKKGPHVLDNKAIAKEESILKGEFQNMLVNIRKAFAKGERHDKLTQKATHFVDLHLRAFK